jgi:hypothetical protein
MYQIAHRLRSPQQGLAAALLALLLHLPLPARAATVLTFDVSGGVTNFQEVPAAYGDRDVDTPNVVVDYGAPGELPSLWTTGYGDLVNTYFNDQDSDTTLTLTLTADPGIHAVLLGFDLASYSAGGQTLAGLSVLDGGGNPLFSQGSTAVPGSLSGGHAHLDFGPDGLAARVVTLVLDLTGLGMTSDNIAIDNVTFAQAVPEPSTGLLLGLVLLGLAARTAPMEGRRPGTRQM